MLLVQARPLAVQVDVSHTLVERLFVQLAGDVQGVLRRGQFVQVRRPQVFLSAVRHLEVKASKQEPCGCVLQGLQLYARAHSLVEAETPVQQAQARRVSGTPSSGELARARAPGTPPSAARVPHSVLCSRPGSAPAAQGPPSALQHPHAAHALQRLAEDPGKAAPVPGPWPGSVAAWATQPPAYPTAAAALVRCSSKRRSVSPGTTPCDRRDAHGAERQVLEPIQPASRQADSGLLPRMASRQAAGPACQSSRRPGTAPGSLMSSHGACAEPHGGYHAEVAWRAATAMGTSRDPEHRLHVDRVRRQMLCAGLGLPDALQCAEAHTPMLQSGSLQSRHPSFGR